MSETAEKYLTLRGANSDILSIFFKKELVKGLPVLLERILLKPR